MQIRFTAKSYFNLFQHPLAGVSIWAWMSILWRAKFALHPAFWLRAIFLTVFSLMNLPFHLIEILLFSGRINRQEVKAPIFIVGHPRSGTTYLHYLMSQDPSLAYCSVHKALLPNVFLVGGNFLKGIMRRGIPDKRPQDNVRMHIDSPKEEEFAMANMGRNSFMFGFFFPRRAEAFYEEGVALSSKKDEEKWSRNFDFLIRKLSYANNSKQLVLKSPANLSRIEQIRKLFPDAKFVHIHRDPIEVYRSTIRLYEKIVPMTSFQKVNEDELHDFILGAYVKMHESYFKTWNKIEANNGVEITYDAITANPIDSLKLVYTDLGMDWAAETEEAIHKEVSSQKDYQKNQYEPLDDSIMQELKERWSSTAEKLGYSL